MSKQKAAGFILEVCQTKDDLTSLKRTKARLEKEIKGLELEKETCREYLNRQDNDTLRVVCDLNEITRERKSLSTLEDYFIDEPCVIPETRRAWGILADELRSAGVSIEKWLSSRGNQKAEGLK